MKRKAIVAILIISLLSALLLCSCEPIKYSVGEDTTYVILQISDLHLKDNKAYQRRAFRTLTDLVEAILPDLIVVTGDLTSEDDNLGVIKVFCEKMNEYNIPWCYTFGNHDPEGDFSKAEISSLLESYPLCKFVRGEEGVFGYGNYYLNVKNSLGEVVNTVFFLDTSGETGGAVPFDQTQIEWYERTVRKVEAEEGRLIPSIAFFHIPLEEYVVAYKEAVEKGEVIFGTKGEEECPANTSDNMFEKMLEIGSTKAVFCGHDHYNDYMVDYKGIRLSYSETFDHKLYVPTRGGLIVNIKEDGSVTEQNVSRKRDSAKYTVSAEF